MCASEPDGDEVAVPDGDDVALEATRWLADARIDEAARARSRQRWLRQQAEEGATFVGLLLTLVEGGADTSIVLTDGSVVDGTMTAVAADHVGLVEADGSATYVALAAIAAIRPAAEGRRAASDARRSRSERRLWDVVAEAVADRPHVVIRAGGATVTGVLTGAGVDVLSVAGERPATPVTYLPSDSVVAVSFRSSG